MRYKLVSVLAVSVLCLLTVGTVEAGEAKFRLGVCVMGTRHPYFRDMLDEITREAAKVGAEIIAGDADFSHERQVGIIEGYIADGLSMILVAPFDAKALNPTLDRAGRAGIPVMSIDAATDGYSVVSHVASDNTAGGRLAAGFMLERLAEKGYHNKGAILVFDHGGVTSTGQRIKGFRDVMGLRGRQYAIRVVDGVGQTRFAVEKTQSAIDSLGDDLAGIFASNDGMALGALQAAQYSDRLEDLVLVGYDYVEELKMAVDEGKMSGIVVQFPRRIGASAFKIAYDYLTGKDRNPPKEYLVEVGTYSREGFLDQRGNPTGN